MAIYPIVELFLRHSLRFGHFNQPPVLETPDMSNVRLALDGQTSIGIEVAPISVFHRASINLP